MDRRTGMRSTLSLVVLVAVLVAGTVGAQNRFASGRKKPGLRWASSVVLGVEEARLRNVPIVLHLHSDT
jgi:hypothetical protein